jgi:UDP-glucose 4-epimerase
MKKILVTGGLGYIGSHTVVALQQKGYDVLILDDLSNAQYFILENIQKITGILPNFTKLDLCDMPALQYFFSQNNDFEAVIHFAAKKSVGESVQNPILYYQNNLNSLGNILLCMAQFKIKNFIFSSSCTVYGQPDELPVTENTPLKSAFSPYGNTKQISEEMIFDFQKNYPDFNVIILRYFNPVGAHHSALIGELPIGVPNNLMPYITQTAIGKREKLYVFGNDYPTNDGTCIRDYIHVVDLADAHVASAERLFARKNAENIEIFNLGTGKGSSVLEVINSFEKITHTKVNVEFAPRRDGDVTAVFADCTKANEILGWKAKKTLDDMTQSAWKWEMQMINGK